MKFFLIVLTILFNLNGYAAQLGKITVKSTQDSLFDAEIILTLDKEDDIKKMIPSIASREIYSLQGMQRQKIHSDIKINLSKVEPNKALIFLKSSVPAKESFIDLLVQIESPKGKILKEYTVLLDPPLPKSKDLPKSQIVKKDNTNKKETEKKIQVRNTKVLITKAGKTLFQIARENGTVSLMLLAIQGLIETNLVDWVSSMTYQAASGAGAQNMKELVTQMGEIHASVANRIEKPNFSALELDRDVQKKINSSSLSTDNFGGPLAGSLIPWIDQDLDNGRSKEEWKGQAETNKILALDFDSIKVDGICVRIGTMRSHSQALTIKLKKNIDLDSVVNLLSNGNKWIKLVDNNKKDSIAHLTPAAVSGKLDIAIGRVRMLDLEENIISAFTVGDQLLWGAAEPLRRMLNILINKES